METLIILAEARTESLDALKYYSEQDEGLGYRFWRAYEECLSRILHNADLYQNRKNNYRFGTLKGFPFHVVYRKTKHAIIVTAVHHHARKPDYWDERSQGQ